MPHFGDLSAKRDRRDEMKVEVVYGFSDISADRPVSEEEVDIGVGEMQLVHSFFDEVHGGAELLTAELVHIDEVFMWNNKQMVRCIRCTSKDDFEICVFIYGFFV